MNLVPSITTHEDQAARLRSLFRATDSAPAKSESNEVRGRIGTESSGQESAAPGTSIEARRATTIAIASGKGGVGKTTLAVNLALALADAGVHTVLLDGDLGMANADLLLGVTAPRHLGHALDGKAGAIELLTPVDTGLHLVAGGSGLAQLADLNAAQRQRLLQVVGEIESRSHALVIDCGAGIGPGVLDLVAAADEALIVTTPEPTAIADAYGLIKSLVRRGSSGGPPACSLFVNEAKDEREARSVHERVASVCHRFLMFPLPLAGWSPADPLVSKAVRARTPLVRYARRSPAATAVATLAQRLRDDLALMSTHPAPQGRGFVARLLRAIRPDGRSPSVGAVR